MKEIWDTIQQYDLARFSLAAAVLLVGALLGQALGRLIQRRLSGHVSLGATTLFRRGAFYGLFVLAALEALTICRVDVSAILGAAGVAGIAVGFAAQTTISNMISGLFLIIEHPFRLGDVIEIGNTRGAVLSIDLLSVKLRTPDNLFVRIPNEQMIKERVTNLSRHENRRVEVPISVGYGESLARVQQVFAKVALSLPGVLAEPAPEILVDAFEATSVRFLVRVWVLREHFAETRSELHVTLHAVCAAEKIEIPSSISASVGTGIRG